MLVDVPAEDHMVEAPVPGDCEPAREAAFSPWAEDKKRDPAPG